MDLYTRHGAIPSVCYPLRKTAHSPYYGFEIDSKMETNMISAVPDSRKVGLCCHCGKGTLIEYIISPRIHANTKFYKASRTMHTTLLVCSATSASVPTVIELILLLTSRITNTYSITKLHEALDHLQPIAPNASFHHILA